VVVKAQEVTFRCGIPVTEVANGAGAAAGGKQGTEKVAVADVKELAVTVGVEKVSKGMGSEEL
jgi:hypothetical protein